MKSLSKCILGHRLYSIKIDFRIDLRTTKKTIGKLCPICDSNIVRAPTEFWKKFVIDKKETIRIQEQTISSKGKNPNFETKHLTKCGNCGFSKWTVCRKRIPTKDAKANRRDLKSWECKCNKCGEKWIQDHARIWKYSEL